MRQTLLLLLLSTKLFSQCSDDGAGRNDREKALNKLKNRSCRLFAGDTIYSVPIDSILMSGADQGEYSTKSVISVMGYVILQKYGEAESCNCKSRDKAKWDIHLEIGKAMSAMKTETFIAEVTPKYFNRDQVDWRSFVGRKVEVTGYVFYDEEHKQNAVSTNPTGTSLWRATITEIHPVINIKIIE